MASWGDINAVMNRLVREGVIGGFRTNRGGPDAKLGLHVTITPPSAENVSRDDLQAQIEKILLPLADDAKVTIDQSQTA